MIGIFSETTINVFKNIKNVFRQIATWTLIAGVVFGCILICLGDFNANDIVAKIMAMFFNLGIAMLVCTNNIRRIENERPAVQIFALISLVCNAIWFLLWSICIWADVETVFRGTVTVGSFATTASVLSFFALIASNTMAIYEGDKKGTILPLKASSIAALGVVSLHGIVTAFSWTDRFSKSYIGSTWQRFDTLAGFLTVAWIILLIVALVTSSGESSKVKAVQRKQQLEEKKQKRAAQQQAYYEQQQAYYAQQQEAFRQQQEAYEKQKAEAEKASSKKAKSDDELRAEIEEKVRREMIEKEVREKLEKEAKATKTK
ncbi:hypothetical protein J6T21_00480 [Candidatus Saccharibacteria bacterium]|nr:hypothetical protein [Candidatus Saccharibacteria bacterium]